MIDDGLSDLTEGSVRSVWDSHEEVLGGGADGMGSGGGGTVVTL